MSQENKRKLYEIKGGYLDLFELASNEEMAKEFSKALADTKESLDFELEEKAYNYAKVCKNLEYQKSSLEGQADFLKKELENVQGKIKSIENNRKRLLEILSEAMQLTGKDKFKNEQFTIYHTTSTSVEVLDKNKALEQGYAKTEIVPQKDIIKMRLKSGEELDFAELKTKKTLNVR